MLNKMEIASPLVLLLITGNLAAAVEDPCYSYKILYDDGSRSSQCDRYYPKSQDRFIDEGWRRVQMESTGEDLLMPTSCVKHGSCGSHSAVWLNGSHPSVEDGVVDRTGCLSMFSSCCHTQYSIQIKNCSSYMVYNLKRTLGSDERYCFGNSLDCFTTTSTTVSTTTTLYVKSKTEADVPYTSPTVSNMDPDVNKEKTTSTLYDGEQLTTPYKKSDASGKYNGKPLNHHDDDVTTVTIILSVLVVFLVMTLLGSLMVMKVFYRPAKKFEEENKLNGNGGLTYIVHKY